VWRKLYRFIGNGARFYPENEMLCPSCSHENRDGARFCEACGEPMAFACIDCGAELRPGARFCDRCGTAVAAGRKATPTPSATVNEGERRVVTVLFADAVGHTEVSEQLGEEKTYELMQGCFKRMQRAVEQYGGSVNQYTGDGVLALFGAPLAREHAARRAVAAALAMQNALQEYAEEVHQVHPIQCSYRIGLNTGPVVVGSISEKLDLELAAVGDTVNLAARMQTLAEPGTVCVSENTHRAVQEYFEFESLGEQAVKGKAKPILVYRPLRERGVQNRLEVSLERGLTPYTGREQEQKVLAGYLTRASSGQGQVVLLSGEAGIGKSRTLFEFNRAMDPRRLHWISGQCISFGENIPYLPVVDVFKSAFDVQETDDAAQIISKVQAQTSSWDDACRATEPYIRFLLNVDPGDDDVAAMDPQVRRVGFFDAFRAIVTELSRTRTVVIAIEDLHWVDEQSEEIISSIVDYISRLPILLLLTARPGYKNTFGDRSHVSRMALSHLPANSSAAMVERALGASGLPDELQTLIATKAEGNPFFIEEVIRSLVEIGALRETNGTFTLECGVDNISVPDTIHEVILARIDRLHPAAKDAMQLASVIGREFTVRLLTRITDLEHQLSDTLSELKSLELIYETGFMPELSYMFKHALTHDVAYSTLLQERRRRLHRTVAEAIEALFADRIAEHYEALAYHYEVAEDWPRAVKYLGKSGEKAFAAFAARESISYFSRGIAACSHLGDGARQARARLLQSRGGVADMISDFPTAIADFKAAAEIGKDLGDASLEGIALSQVAYTQWENHEFDASETVAQEALALAGETNDNVRFAAMSILSYNYITTGRRIEGEQFTDELLRLSTEVNVSNFQALWVMEQLLSSYWQARFQEAINLYDHWSHITDRYVSSKIGSQWAVGMCTASLGGYGKALKNFLEALAFADRVGSGFYGLRLTNTIGWVYNEIQDFENGLAWNERSLEGTLNYEVPDTEIACNARLNIGEALVVLGRTDEALAQYQIVESVIRNPKPEDRMSLHSYSMHWFHAYGELLLAQGDAASVASLADECVVLAEENNRQRYIVKGLRLKVQAQMALGETSTCANDLNRALDLSETIGNPTQTWKTWAVAGAFHVAAGNEPEAANAYAKARSVITLVADGLDPGLRETFLGSAAVHPILAADGAV
jgi:class 3 adenylate cyclase/tetratricopeptide (TPR) repeat protein